MKLKCNYCGSFIKDTDEKCPNCGAVNEHLMRSADGIPKTIEELKAFCQKHNLPLKQMRFSSVRTSPSLRHSAYTRTMRATSSSIKTRRTAAAP